MTISSKFVIIGVARTGSNYLCSTLDCNKRCLCFAEMFNSNGVFGPFCKENDTSYSVNDIKRRDLNIKDCLKEIFKERIGFQSIGFKLLMNNNVNVENIVINDVTIKKIILIRDPLAMFVSNIQAMQSNAYVYDPQKAKKYSYKVYFDKDSYEVFRKKVDVFYSNILSTLDSSSQNYILLNYDDIFSEKKYRLVLNFINTDYDGEYGKSVLKKQGSILFKDRIANYNETAEYFRKNQYNSDIIKEGCCVEAPNNDINEMKILFNQHINSIKANCFAFSRQPRWIVSNCLETLGMLAHRIETPEKASKFTELQQFIVESNFSESSFKKLSQFVF